MKLLERGLRRAVHGAGNDTYINICLRLPNEVICPEQRNKRKSSKDVKQKKKKNACIFVLNLKLLFLFF